MEKKPVVIVYKSRNRDISPLDKACKARNLTLHVAETEEQFRHELTSGAISCIIVPIRSDEEGTNDSSEFVNIAAKALQPEDADVSIIYSCEGDTSTPKNWPESFDPKPIQFYEPNPPDFITSDTDWKLTLERIKSVSVRTRFSHACNRIKGIVDVELSQNSMIPFPSEATFLLRAAFKDMSKVIVEFPKQGLSGSIACDVQPFDKFSNNCKRVFVKIYPDHGKAIRDLYNFSDCVEPYIESDHYPQYQHFRKHHGKAYSLLVTELTEGPNGTLTFKNMIESEKYSVERVRTFIRDALLIMDNGNMLKKDKGWKCNKPTKPRDLLEDYILEFLEDKDKRIRLDSENICNKWFGDFSDGLPLENKIRNSLPKAYLEGTHSKTCHGDLHSDNMMVKSSGGRLIPVFIDFSRTGETHSLKDLVTLESDMIIRGLGSIKSFSDKRIVRSFLETLSFTPDNKECKTDWTKNMNESLQLQKVQAVIKELRNNAISFHKVPPSEYECAALLKTLEVLSYGKLPHDKTVRATSYVTCLMERLRIAKYNE